MSHLRESRATLTRDKGSCVKVASVTGHIARCVMARRTVARLVFGIERSLFCATLTRVKDAQQSRRCDIGLSFLRCDTVSVHVVKFCKRFEELMESEQTLIV